MFERVFNSSEYSGKPINNLKWAKCKEVLGVFWQGKTVEEFNSGHSVKYEFVRGEISLSHLLSNYENFYE